MKSEAFQIPDICSECGFLDFCPAEGECVRAYLRALGFDTGMPIEDARQIIADHKQSAIIEPPTQAELAGLRVQPSATEISGVTLIDADRARAAGYKISALAWPDGEPSSLSAMADNAKGLTYIAQFSRPQVRAAIDEISKAQPQIVAGLKNPYSFNVKTTREIEAEAKTAANVLEALPEAVAHAFGLTIRGACAECGTTLFREEPYTSNAAGKPTCEAHANPEAA